MNRSIDLEAIRHAVSRFVSLSASGVLLIGGDSLALLRSLPNQCVSLVLTDPPYHATKKRNIYGDTAFEEDAHYLEWMSEYVTEWRRILRPNGSLFCFCDSSMAGRLERLFDRSFNVLSHIVWTKPNDPGFDGWKQKMRKEALRQWYAHSERIIFAEPAFEGNLHRSYFGNLLRQIREKAGVSAHELTKLVGAYGRVNHGGAVSNWEAGRNIPSREQYKRLCDALVGTGKVKTTPCFEDAIRPFNVDASKEFTDVWTFPSVRPYHGKHPAEKPIEMLRHAIEATTYPGDIVLDCFSGSGNAAIAAARCGRSAVLMDADEIWVARAAKKIELEIRADGGSYRRTGFLPQTQAEKLGKPQERLLFPALR